MKTIDSHAHIWLPDSADYPWDRQASTPPAINASVASLLAAMEDANVDQAVLIQHSCYGYDNRYILDCARHYPDKFCTIIKIDPLDPASPDQLRQLVANNHIQGLRFHAARDPESTWLRAPETYPLWETAAELGVVIGILVDPRQLGQAHEIISRFPQVKVIIDHMGRVNVAEPPEGERFQQLLSMAQYPHVYVKVSGFYALSKQSFPYADCMPYVAAIVDAFGVERLMWATDFPLLVNAGESYSQSTRVLHHQLPQLDEAAMAWLMGKTAQQLFKFDVAR